MIYLVIIIITLISYTEGLSLIKNKKWREFITMETILCISLLLTIGEKLGIVTPLAYLNKMLSPIGKAILGNN